MEKLKRCCDQRLRDSSFERDRANGFSWPQRRYRCSFCSKEFMSAQALGGHMNVHRRDRARMRLYPSWDSPNTPNPSPNPNTNPNPNPNPSLPSTSRFSSFNDVINSSPSLQENGFDRSSPHNITSLLGEDIGKQNEAGEVLEFTHFTTKNGARVRKVKDFGRLDLNLGSLIQDAKEDSDLDLELRL